jgi:CSLREA domain-containing protein
MPIHRTYLWRKTLNFVLAVVISLASFAAPPPPQAHGQAATLLVNSLNDPGTGTCDLTECTLREAISAAAAEATIQVQAQGRLNLRAGELVINKNLTIVGPGAAAFTIDGNGLLQPTSRIVQVSENTTVTLRSMSLFGGNVGTENGGGIWNKGTLLLTDVDVLANQGRLGGGIFNERGTLIITRSNLSFNAALRAGGGLLSINGEVRLEGVQVTGNSAKGGDTTAFSGYGGGIFVSGGTAIISNSSFLTNRGLVGGGFADYASTNTIIQSTFSNNEGVELGGAIASVFSYATTLQSSTITNNRARDGGGIVASGTTIRLQQSVVAANTATLTNPDLMVINRELSSQGYNLIGVYTLDSTRNVLQATDQTGTITTPLAPQLAPFTTHNDYLAIHVPLAGSPLLDKIPAAQCGATLFDQRGLARPQGAGCDIGAIELAVVNRPPSVSLAGTSVVNEGDSMSFTANASDPDGDVLLYQWKIGDAGYGEPTTLPSTAAYVANGPATLPVQVLVSDPQGLTATASLSVTVYNLPPTAEFSAPATVNAGEAFTVTLLNPFDPSPDDTLNYAFDCGSGLGYELSSSPSFTCTAGLSGTLAVEGKISDNDGGSNAYSALVAIFTPPPAAATATELTLSNGRIVYGQPLVLNATVQVVAPDTGIVTGSISFYAGSILLGEAALHNGQARLSINRLGVGSHQISAIYNADASGSHARSQSSPHTVWVRVAPTETALRSSPNPSWPNQRITLTAQVQAQRPGIVTPHGAVLFYRGGQRLGKAWLRNGVATLTVSSFPAGTHQLRAVYLGNPRFASSRTSVQHKVQ